MKILATPYVQYKIWKAADKKRALSCVALKKKKPKREKTLFY